MNVDTRAERDHIEGTVRRILLQYAYLKNLSDGAVSAINPAEERSRVSSGGFLSAARMWLLTVDFILTEVDHEMNVISAWKATARRLVGNQRWIDVAEALGMNVEGTKEIVSLATAKMYAQFVGRGISEDYKQQAA
jgi:hypothetical protein